MKNYVQDGDILTFTAAANIASGDGVLQGSLFGVAATAAATGEDFAASIEGVFDLPKATGAITAGAKVYWNSTSGNVTTTATGNTLIGAATQAATSGAATARVRLNGTV